jgi:hypothetical protein
MFLFVFAFPLCRVRLCLHEHAWALEIVRKAKNRRAIWMQEVDTKANGMGSHVVEAEGGVCPYDCLRDNWKAL